MQTSPVLNIIAPVQAQTNKQADTGASSDSFNQALSREIADRQSASETPKTQEVNASNSAKPAPGNEAPAAKEKAKTEDADKPADDVDASAKDATDATSVINDMLALVASFNPVLPPAPQSAASASTAAADIALDTDLSHAKPGADIAALARDPASLHPASSNPSLNPASLKLDSLKPDSLKPATGVAIAAKADTKGDAATPAGDKFATDFARALDKTSASEHASDKTAAKPEELSDPAMKPVQDLAATMKDTVAKAETKAEVVIDTKEPPAVLTPPLFQQTAQPAVNNLTHLVAAPSHDRLAPQVGTPAWNDAFAQKVTWMVAGEQQSASLTLNPPDLGPLQVVLNVTNSHANATFIAAQPEVRQALEAAMPRLRDMLSDAGIQLGQANVSSGSPGQQGAPDQQSSQARRPDFSTPRFDMSVKTSGVQTGSSGLGLVDTFV